MVKGTAMVRGMEGVAHKAMLAQLLTDPWDLALFHCLCRLQCVAQPLYH